jgi:hypothetical protein
VEGGGYLMHWQAVGGTTITNGQARVIRGHAAMSPGSSAVSKRSGAPADLTLTADDVAELQALPPHWCGTCAHCNVTKPGR